MAEKNGGMDRSKAQSGQTILQGFPRDNSSFSVPNTKGGSMGGSNTNLAHSLPGASAQMRGGKGSGVNAKYKL